MAPNEGISNRNQNETEASKELNAWLLKRLSDRAFPFIARSALHACNLGQSTTKLARQLVERGSMVLNVSRASRLSLLSRAFDYIRGKRAFVSPVW